MEKRAGISTYWNLNVLEWLIVIGCQLIFIGFTCSRALVSIGMIAILAGSLLFFRYETLKKYFAKKELLILSLFFWIVFFSGIYSINKEYWLEWVRIKLPYLALPIAFAPLRKLDNRKFILVLYGFMLAFFICTLAVLINYFAHYESMNQSFLRGSTIPMPFSHIRYALMLTFSLFCALYLWQQGQYFFLPSEKWLQFVYVAFVFVALHILAVRSALIALYPGLIFFAIWQVKIRKKVIPGIAFILVLLTFPFAAYQLMPSVHNKIGYMHYDLGKYEQGKINQYSDAMRILSMQIGLQVWEKNKLIGVGMGDFRDATDKIYETEHPEIPVSERRQPHNEFIWVLASTGIAGLALFLLAFFYPILVKGYYKSWLFVVFYIIIFSSFFTEVTLEEQMGTGFYLIFLMLLMNHFQPE